MQTRPWQTPDWPTPGTTSPEQYLLLVFFLVGLPLLACYIVFRFWAKRRETGVVREVRTRETTKPQY